VLYSGIFEIVSLFQKFEAFSSPKEELTMAVSTRSRLSKKKPLPVTVLSGFLVNIDKFLRKDRSLTYILG
jgi:hypothetical protein